ncbi:MAG TPA: AbrB/MazE/SpoVT family DNA-binding domain-containing protein [bacterium]|jgi:antitoxin MazE|nr:AbrB/MazE/SpoVT family DNA-binding domain-containing protein [bacterium]
MIKKLTKHGNSYALVIDRGIMDLLNISEKSALYVTTDGRKLIVSPADEKDQTNGKKSFEEAVQLSLKRYSKAYKKLAN